MSFLTSAQTDKLYPALIQAQSNMPTLLKESKAHHGKYAGIEDIIRAAYPWLTAHKLSVLVGPTWYEGQMFVSCRILHESDQFIEGMIPVFGIPLEKDNSQGFGARISYVSRYILRSMLGFHNAELDDDGDYEANVVKKQSPLYVINQEQIAQLVNMMADRPEIKDRLLSFYKIKSLEMLPAAKFWEAHDAILKIKERYKNANN